METLQKRALVAISSEPSGNNADINHIHYDLRILNFDHQLQSQLSSLMWDYDHDTLPRCIKTHFKRANLVDNYNARSAAKGNLYYSKVNTTKHGTKSFKYQGIKILNNLKSMHIYQSATTKRNFLDKMKSDLLSSYIA